MRYFAQSRSIGFSYVLIISLVAGEIAHADDEGSSAKSEFMEGVALFSSEDYSGALDAFSESYRLSPKSGTLFNIAMCYKALYRYVNAIAAFRGFIDKVDRDKYPEKVERAEEALLELEALTGQITFIDAPIDATITVNDNPVGKVPLNEPLILDPGSYKIEVSKAGFETLSTSVILDSGATVPLRAALKSESDINTDLPAEADPTAFKPITKLTVENELTEDVSTLSILSLVSGGVGVATIGVGAYFNYQREVTDIDDARAATDALDHAKIVKRSEEHEAAMAICYTVGGLFLVSGILLYILDEINHQTDSLRSALNHDHLTLHF